MALVSPKQLRNAKIFQLAGRKLNCEEKKRDCHHPIEHAVETLFSFTCNNSPHFVVVPHDDFEDFL